MAHPYEKYESTPAWRVIDEAITALVKNHDLQETTARQYIVGYLCKQLSEAALLHEVSES